jgi:hypothetical protein
MPTALNQQRGIDKADRCPGDSSLSDPSFTLLNNGRVKDRLQPFARLGIGKRHGTQPPAINSTVRSDDLMTERRSDRPEKGPVRLY